MKLCYYSCNNYHYLDLFVYKVFQTNCGTLNEISERRRKKRPYNNEKTNNYVQSRVELLIPQPLSHIQIISRFLHKSCRKSLWEMNRTLWSIKNPLPWPHIPYAPSLTFLHCRRRSKQTLAAAAWDASAACSANRIARAHLNGKISTGLRPRVHALAFSLSHSEAPCAFYLGAHITFNIPNGWRGGIVCEGIFWCGVASAISERRQERERRYNLPLRNIRNLWIYKGARAHATHVCVCVLQGGGTCFSLLGRLITCSPLFFPPLASHAAAPVDTFNNI